MRSMSDLAERYVFDYENRHADPYWQAAMDAWRRIAEPACLPGAVRWLEKHQPALYRELMEELPGEIGRSWDARAPLDQFQYVLDRWVDAHREACVAYERFSAQGPRNTKA